jgi:hypothetical protein
MAVALDPDPQVDYLAGQMVDLGRYVKSQGLDGRFAIEFSAHHGDIRSARTIRETPLPQPPAAKP